jgi:hypothetical protein
MRTIREGTVDGILLRVVEKDRSYVGVLFTKSGKKIEISGEGVDDVWRKLHSEAAKHNPKYVGFAGARSRFLHFFPNGFDSEGFEKSERRYKLNAKDHLDKAAPLEKAAAGSGFGEAVLAAFSKTNLLSPYEITRLSDLLRGRDADQFVRAAAKFTLAKSATALSAMAAVLKPHDCAKWTMATYLPFLWRPESHMFLKPEATKDFAARVGHPFAASYDAALEFAVYESLLDLVEMTEAELAELRPRDRIDVQSVIWVVGNYNTETESPRP